jgi:DNA-binding transcriptional ArsR family regulator
LHGNGLTDLSANTKLRYIPVRDTRIKGRRENKKLKEIDSKHPDDEARPSETKKPRRSTDRSPGSSTPVDFDPDTELRGRTLRAYLFILKSPKAIGVRELQRSLGLSSPSVAYHHLDKLTRLGLIEKDQYGEYTIVKNANVNVLQAFTQVGRLLVPRFIFYAVFFSTLLIGYIIFFGQSVNFFAIAFGVFASIFAWYEAYRTWKRRPF